MVKHRPYTAYSRLEGYAGSSPAGTTKNSMNEFVFHNLSQALGERCCYLRSTDVEQKNYNRLLWCITDEMLMQTYIFGKTIVVVDYSSHERGKIDRIFLPALNAVLRGEKAGPLESTAFQIRVALASDSYNAARFKHWQKLAKFKPMFIGRTIKVEKEMAREW